MLGEVCPVDSCIIDVPLPSLFSPFSRGVLLHKPGGRGEGRPIHCVLLCRRTNAHEHVRCGIYDRMAWLGGRGRGRYRSMLEGDGIMELLSLSIYTITTDCCSKWFRALCFVWQQKTLDIFFTCSLSFLQLTVGLGRCFIQRHLTRMTSSVTPQLYRSYTSRRDCLKCHYITAHTGCSHKAKVH